MGPEKKLTTSKQREQNMFGWKRRTLFTVTPSRLPLYVRPADGVTWTARSAAGLFAGLAVTFLLATAVRFLELPFWDNPAYFLDNEFLLATHDAYHWIAGAEGFEFGAGHPMSELVRLTAEFFKTSPALAGFWMPPFLSGLLAAVVFLWGWGLGRPYAGASAGILASLAPSFFARTLLGFCDTDLVVVLFAVSLGLVPAIWLSPWLASLPDVFIPRLMNRIANRRPAKAGKREAENEENDILSRAVIFSPSTAALKGECPAFPLVYGKSGATPGTFTLSRQETSLSALSPFWLFLLITSGLFGWQTQFWHSMFPYLVRYCALLLAALILVLGPFGARFVLLQGAACHALPLLAGLPGAAAAAAYAVILRMRRSSSRPVIDTLAQSRILLWAIWLIIIFLVLDSTIFYHMRLSFTSYADRSGDILSSSLPDPIVFPSVTRSIIETQTISFAELLIYAHPVEIISVVAFLLALWGMLVTPAFLWLLPLLVLFLLSPRMGARMTLFGPPVLMLALCMGASKSFSLLFYRLRIEFLKRCVRRVHEGEAPFESIEKAARRLLHLGPPARLTLCLSLTFLLAWPLITPLPEYAQGPIISREQAQGLRFLNDHSEKDSIVWNWWDWGYATHHFAHRTAIADGARHGGPSLYLPAAVYTTADPRFARQVIKYTALKGNVPGNVFHALSATEAQFLMRDLGDKEKPLIQAEGKQYLVVSLDLLRLGLWISRFGSWNFITREGPGALLNTLTPALHFNPDTGEIMSEGSRPFLASGITFFEAGGLEQYRYSRPDGYFFLFNIRKNDAGGPGKDSAIRRFWLWQRGEAAFPGPISDKLVMDQVFFNSMMVQLLICPENDPAISPYFKLVFDNTYTRIYEVQ